MNTLPIERWPPLLEEAVRNSPPFARAFVLREADSTQDEAKRLCARPGDVIVAWRQTAGRGRLGRPWHGGDEGGLAATFALPPTPAARLALVAAVGAAHAMEDHLGRPAGLKWPNDVIVDRRKVAGILVEQDPTIALAGIGVNVSQTAWPRELATTAISLRQAGCEADRFDVLVSLVRRLSETLALADDEVERRFLARDVLTGCDAVLVSGGREHRGVVAAVEPSRGITLRTESASIVLPAATTTVISAKGPRLDR